MSRSQVRERVFCLIFELLFDAQTQARTPEDVDAFLSELGVPSEGDRAYAHTLYNGVVQNIEPLKARIAGLAQGFTLDRMVTVDLALLLLASYEILHMPDIPAAVSCNEAVTLAKTYSTEKSPAYINGILANIVKQAEGK
ncbi:MAG: transcription antitermination factor NusB [Clostridiales bacterium]|jgi:N utilization substance protein B|nr:transcription antitermination factor NusB [Clostridiales bacterium]